MSYQKAQFRKTQGQISQLPAQVRWLKRMGMQPVESAGTREEAFKAACEKVERHRLSTKVDLPMDFGGPNVGNE